MIYGCIMVLCCCLLEKNQGLPGNNQGNIPVRCIVGKFPPSDVVSRWIREQNGEISLTKKNTQETS